MSLCCIRRLAVQVLLGLVLAIPVRALANQSHGQDASPVWLAGKLKIPLSKIKIGISEMYPASNAYQAVYMRTDKKYCTELGVQCKIMDPEGDAQKQFEEIGDLASEHLNAIIVFPVSAVAEIPAIKKAHDTGVPIVVGNAHIAKPGRKFTVGFAGPDDCLQAKHAANEMVQALHGKGNIVMIIGTPGFSVTRIREKCFLKVLHRESSIKVLATQPANWEREKAQSVTETFLTKFGKRIDGIYAEDDGMGDGVVNALKEAHIPRGKVILTTGNQFPQGYVNIEDGWEYGSVGQSPKLSAILAIQTAVRVAEGEKVPRVQHIATPPITRRNIFYFKKPDWSVAH